MSEKADLKNIVIVLFKPKYPGNIGSVARCAKNMGIEKLFVIGTDKPDREEMYKMATHFARDLVENICYFETLEAAFPYFNYIVGTTARLGNSTIRRGIRSPREMADELIGVSRNNTVALLFGPEDTGLTNEELKYCDMLVTISTTNEMKSINLSHAVMIMCYEIFTATSKTVKSFMPRLANSAEVNAMYERLKEVFIKINFVNPENPDYWMMYIRRFFSRAGILSKDVRIVLGICRQIDLYGAGKTKNKKLDFPFS